MNNACDALRMLLSRHSRMKNYSSLIICFLSAITNIFRTMPIRPIEKYVSSEKICVPLPRAAV